MNILFADNLARISFVKHGFFGRLDGHSSGIFESLNVGLKRGDIEQNVLKNRYKIAEYFGQKSLFIPNQIHSNIPYVINNMSDEIPECDAIITNKPGILIGVHTADCVPILLCDIEKKYIAAIHSGWRGALSGVIENTISKMKKEGCQNIIGSIGPCIHQKSFEFGEEIIEKVDEKYIKDCHFDIQFYVEEKLLDAGIKDVSKIDVDTFSNNQYFSYRRNTTIKNMQNCGVQFSGIVILENNDE